MFSFSPGVACFNRSVYQRYSAPQPRISPRASCGRRRCPTMGPFVAVRRSFKRHRMSSQWPSASNAPPACGPCDPTAILPPGQTPSAAPRQFHLRPADTTRRSVFSDFAVPSVRVCQSGVPAAGPYTPARSPAPQPIPLSDDQFRQSPDRVGAACCTRPDSARIRRGSGATAPGRGPSALQGRRIIAHNAQPTAGAGGFRPSHPFARS